MLVTTPSVKAWSGVLGDTPAISPSEDNKHVWSVLAEDGRSYILKHIGRWRPGASLADEFRVLLHLQAAGISVALHVPTDDAKLFAGEIVDKHILVPLIPAQPIDHELEPDAEGSCFRIGRSIGLLHKALESYPWPVASFTENIAEGFAEAYEILPAELQALLAEPSRKRADDALTGLPDHLMHGDCTPGNVLLRRELGHIVVAGFIDLDHLPHGQRIHDLGKYLSYQIRELVRHPADRERRGMVFLHLVGCYVAGYQSVNPLSDREIAAIAPAVLAADASNTAWSYRILSGWQDRDQTGHAEAFRLGSLSVAWICEHFDQLENATRIG